MYVSDADWPFWKRLIERDKIRTRPDFRRVAILRRDDVRQRRGLALLEQVVVAHAADSAKFRCIDAVVIVHLHAAVHRRGIGDLQGDVHRLRQLARRQHGDHLRTAALVHVGELLLGRREVRHVTLVQRRDGVTNVLR